VKLKFEGSLTVMLREVTARFGSPPDKSVAAAACDLLERWPLAAREAQSLWTAAG
jgi:hypothetical protein